MRCIAVVVVVLAALGGSASLAAEEQFLKDAKVDLTGTGHLNHVQFQILGNPEQSGKYRLTIDGATLTDSLDEGLQGFKVLDINTGDKLKEIGVFTVGPSDDYAWAIYWYDGRAIHRVGEIGGQAIFPGNGTVVASLRTPSAMTWFYQQKYVLTKDHRLAKVPQEFYPVPAGSLDRHPSGTVRQPFPVYRTRGGKDVVVQPRKGTKLTVMLWDGGKWYGVMTHTGLFGWVTDDTLFHFVEGLPAAD